MRMTNFTRSFLLMFSGPIIWAAHFLAVYTVNGIACARPDAQPAWLGANAALWFILGLSALAIAAIAWMILHVRATRTGDAAPDPARFMRATSVMAGLLAIGAIVAETVPVFIVPMCG